MARDLSAAVPSRERPDGYEPRNPAEAGLIRWLNDNGISVVFAAPGSPSMSDGRSIRLNPEDGTAILFHEAAHTFLNRLGYSSLYRYHMPENLSERARAVEYRQLDQALGRIIDLEGRLRADERGALFLIFGSPESGVTPVSRPGRGSAIAERSSFVGNLVDESTTLGLQRDQGHPIHGFHEFFASSMASLAFDGQKFFRSLQEFERLSRESPRCRRLFEATVELLQSVHRFGAQMQQDLSGAQVPDMHRFERNLARLGKFLELEQPQRRQAGLR